MVFNALLRSLRGSNLEIFKFGLYLSFPIGWMYYFGTNLDERFSIPDFWPSQEQSHKIPFEKSDIKKEVERIRLQIQEREERKARALGAREDGSMGATLAQTRDQADDKEGRERR